MQHNVTSAVLCEYRMSKQALIRPVEQLSINLTITVDGTMLAYCDH